MIGEAMKTAMLNTMIIKKMSLKTIKMKALFTILAFIQFSISAQTLNPFESNGKWGYKNDKGKIIIPKIYDGVYFFNEMGIAPVVKNNKIGFIDIKGKEITQFVYDYKDAPYFAWYYNNWNYQGVYKNKNAGLIDKTGKEIIPTNLGYQEVGIFNQISENEFDNSFFIDGYCPVKKNNKWGFVNLASNEVIKCQFEEIKPIKDGFFAFRQNGKWGIRDIKNKVIVEAIYDNISDFQLPLYMDSWKGYFSFGLCPVAKFGDKSEERWGYITNSGNLVIPFQYISPKRFNENGIIAICKPESCGCINIKGQEVNKLHFEEAYEFDEGVAVVKSNGRYGCINENCELIIPFEYEYIGGFNKGKSAVDKNGEHFYINVKGQKIAPPKD